MNISSFHKRHDGLSGKNAVWLVCLSFLVPLFLQLICAIGLHLVPFGDKHTLAISDGKCYINSLAFFSRLLRGQENALYSLKNGLGGNEWANLAWGGFAPASLLVVFADYETFPLWFDIICFVNMSLCGLSMYLLLAGIYGHKFSHLIFSTSYALIGFNVLYSQELLFFIGVQLLPLMVLGLYRLLQGRSPLLYVLSLGVCIFLNFYFGFILCVVSMNIFILDLYLHPRSHKNRKTLFLRWLAASVISGLFGAPMWLPALKAYSGGGRLEQTTITEFTFTEKAPFIEIFAKLFSGSGTQMEMVNGLPNIFCGILVVALVILFFINPCISRKEKKAGAAVLGFYLLTFYIPAFTLVMHGGTHTNWFPYRYSFVYSFWLILIAAEQFRYIDNITLRECKCAGVLLLVSAILIFNTKYEFVTGGAVVLDFVLLLLMYMGFYLYKTKPETAKKRMLSLLLLLLVCGNLYTNFVITIQNIRKDEWELDLETYNEHNTKYVPMVQALNSIEPGFFRMEKGTSDSSSVGVDPLLYNYNGVSHSGPTERMFIHKGLNRLGINWFDMRHWYNDELPAATDALLGIKYIISKKDLGKNKSFDKLLSIDEDAIYQNHYSLSPAILAKGDICSLVLGDNPFVNLNNIWRTACGNEKNIFTQEDDVTFTLHNDIQNLSVTTRELLDSASLSDTTSKEDQDNIPSTYIEYSFTAKQDGTVFFFDTSIPDSPNGLHSDVTICCGYHRTGESVTGKIPLSGNYATGDFLRGYCQNLVFAYENTTTLSEYASLLNSRGITFNTEHDNHLTGNFTADANQRILFTLPWDEGWTCTIDGQKVPIDKTWDLFMSVEVPEGKHTYEMKFIPAWLNYGLYLSAIAWIGLAILMIVHTKSRHKVKKKPRPS